MISPVANLTIKTSSYFFHQFKKTSILSL